MAGKSLEKMIDEQVKKWELLQTKKPERQQDICVITVSREPGSGGRIVAQRLAEYLKFDLFHQEIVHEMAKSANASTRLIESLDETTLNVLEDWISTLVNQNHLWPDQYLKTLMNVIGTIGKHGQAVIVGRGANFILPPEERFRVRIVAPLGKRVKNVARDFHVSEDEARRRVLKTDSDRRAFIRKYFHADISDPANYDVVVNTGVLRVEVAVEAVKGALMAQRR